jgi:hypothetical protein
MGYPIATGQGADTSVAAYGKSANLVVNRNQFLGKGKITLVARGSAIGMRITLNVGGVALCDDLPVPFIGTTGALSIAEHVVLSQVVAGGVCEFFLRNTTVGALTCDYAVYFEPMK